MHEYKKKKGQLTPILEEMYSTGRRLAHYDKEVKVSVWDREIKKTRTVKPKEPQKVITTYFSENTVKGLCSYYKELEELYFEWIESRANNKKKNFVQFNGSSEKSAWKKLGRNPKPVAERMLEVAAAQGYGMIYDLSEGDISKIMEPLRQEKQKIERETDGFMTNDEKQQAEQKKQQINDYIRNHPELDKQARDHVLEKHPNLGEEYQDKMIETRKAMLASKLIN